MALKTVIILLFILLWQFYHLNVNYYILYVTSLWLVYKWFHLVLPLSVLILVEILISYFSLLCTDHSRPSWLIEQWRAGHMGIRAMPGGRWAGGKNDPVSQWICSNNLHKRRLKLISQLISYNIPYLSIPLAKGWIKQITHSNIWNLKLKYKWMGNTKICSN